MQKNESLTVEIAGGLGNQLFMFYAGLYFQEKYQRKVIFDTSDLSRVQGLHPGANIQTLGLLDDYLTISRSNISNFKVDRVLSGLRSFANRNSNGGTFSSEEIGFINPNSIPPEVKRIRGYFQSWIYFDSLSEKPILSLQNLTSPSKWLLEKKERTKRENVLSLHVRRGDYALPANRKNGILSLSYYREALINAGDYDSIWIFTDSPKEVEYDFLQLGYPFETIIPPNNSDPVESLLLMAATKKIVISNSTYSWWSAMIAGDGSVVYAPSKWYEFRDDPSKLIPDNWKRIPSEWVEQ
jgi:hypothetical protein